MNYSFHKPLASAGGFYLVVPINLKWRLIMKLKDALLKINPFINKRFDTFLEHKQLTDLTTNKGNVGQLLEILIGLSNTSKRLDFEDGELKTNKSDIKGNPKETMFITQISAQIDELFKKTPFEDSYIYKKINNMVYVPVCKEGTESCWRFLPYIHVELENPQFRELRDQLEEDYYSIIDQLIYHVNNSQDGFIHTSNGKFIQIRSKDSKPYHPIYSRTFNKYISNKNHAFYFKKEYMKYLQALSPDYPL